MNLVGALVALTATLSLHCDSPNSTAAFTPTLPIFRTMYMVGLPLFVVAYFFCTTDVVYQPRVMVHKSQDIFSDIDDDPEELSRKDAIEAQLELSLQLDDLGENDSMSSSQESFKELLASPLSLLNTSLSSPSGFTFQSSAYHAEEKLVPCSSKRIPMEASKTKFERKDSGYNTQPLKNSQQSVKFIPYKEPETFNVASFEKELQKADLNVELAAFMDNPKSSKVFYPNFDYYETKLTQDNLIPNLKDFIRRSLQTELDKIESEQAVPLQNAESQKLEQSKKVVNSGTRTVSKENDDLPQRPSSPDLFQSEDESDEPCENADNFLSVLPIEASPDILTETQQQTETSNRFQIGNEIIQFSQIVEQTTARKTRRLIEKIEKTISKFLDKTASGQPMEFFIRNTNVTSNCYLEIDEILTLKPTAECALKRVSTSDRRSQFRFAVIMFLLAEIYHLLATGTTCTLRELYYKDPEFIRDPVNINLGLKDICCLLDAAPWELGVLSSSKGLVAGALVMVLSNGEEIDCSASSGGILLPHDTSGVQSLRSDAKFALVVEKDTVFEKLLKQNIFQFLGQNIILITGKGFPDVNTRVIVKKIATDLKIPIYGLFDADPFGIEIFFVYRHGSRAMSFNADSLACSQMEWVGIHPSEIQLLGIPSMTLTREDNKRLKALLDRPYISDEVRSELLTLERGDRKAEIEGLSSFSENYLLTEYIPNKIRRKFTM